MSFLSDELPEPEIKELSAQLFSAMDDIHEGTRLAAQGSAIFLSKVSVAAASSDHGNSGIAVASSILPLLLDIIVTHTVPDIRRVSIKTISDLIDSSGSLIASHLFSLIPCLLKATGELESTKLSYLSTRLGANNDDQEAVDFIRAEAAKSHHTMETTAKCVHFVDYPALEQMTPPILELIKNSVNLGTKIACAHFIWLITVLLGRDMLLLVGKFLAACFIGLKDRNGTVRKCYAGAIGHLTGIAKEQSIKNLFCKLNELYIENSLNRSVAFTIQSINKHNHELLKDYLDSALPLLFFAMHEEQTEENKSNIELWKELWNEISPGDSGIRMNLNVIISKLEISLSDSSWLRKAQAANAIRTIATRLGTSVDELDRLRLINILLVGLQGRTFQGKERLVQGLAALCKGLDKQQRVFSQLIEAAMRECRKEEQQYRTFILGAFGDILDELEADRFEEVYNMIWYLLEKKHWYKTPTSEGEDSDNEKYVSADERNKRAIIFNKLKETVCEILGKSWPKNSFQTQQKYQLQFAKRCSFCLNDNIRPVQVSLLGALTKFVERLSIFDFDRSHKEEMHKEKEVNIYENQTRDLLIEKICCDVLSAVTYAAGLPHTGLKKESLNFMLILVKRLSDARDMKNLLIIKNSFDENLEKFKKDSSPEVRCRIKDIEEKFSKFKF